MEKKNFDILIIGGGVAGMSAAIYAKRRNKNVAIVEKFTLGGQALALNRIENFPSQAEIDGYSLVQMFSNQIKHLGVEILNDEIEEIDFSKGIKILIGKKCQYESKSVIIATGLSSVELGKNEHFFSRLKNSVNILLPLILTSLNRIDTISNAMELRGFGKNKKRTWYTRRPFERRDFAALGLGVVLLVVSLTVTIKFGRFYNPFI